MKRERERQKQSRVRETGSNKGIDLERDRESLKDGMIDSYRRRQVDNPSREETMQAAQEEAEKGKRR